MATDSVATMVTNVQGRLTDFTFGEGHSQYAKKLITSIMQEFKDQIAKMEVAEGGAHTYDDTGVHTHVAGKIS